eukprot:Tamp_21782.p1 GENE.Tamp_21782~~Tamp_21782.p1  ORF type:complete len:306 (+),score=51.51 Tamp_21782:89-1006(+)
MLPSAAAQASGRGRRSRQAAASRGPQTVPWPMWVLWLVLNGYLYWRYSAPARSLLPRGESVRLGERALEWRSPDGDVELLLPPASQRSAETIWVLSARNAVRSEVVHLHAGFHISLHPVRQTSLVQIIRSAERTGGGAVEVKMASNKKRLTRNTFVVAADSLECLLGQSKCSNVAIIPNKDRPSGPLSEQEGRIGFVHEHGTVSFSTNLTGVMMLAILTGFRDVNQALELPPPPASPPPCPTWVARKSGWDAVARCIQWSACDDGSAVEGGDGQDVSGICARLRCLCTAQPRDVHGCLQTRACTL